MSRPLSFLHLSTFYPPYSFGGDAMQLYRLSRALAEDGHHVEIIHCVDSYHLLHPSEPSLQFPGHLGVVVHQLRSGYKSLSPVLTQQTGLPWLKRRAIAEVLASRPFDVIHFHNVSLLGPGVLSVSPRNSEAVKLYTAHEHWLVCPMHVLWKYDGTACQKPDCLRCCLQSRRPPQLWRYTGLLERMSGHVDQFFSPSRFSARMHAERGFPQPLAHLPNFIDCVDHDWLNPPPRPQLRPYFLFVGRLELIKGLQTVIPLWNETLGCDLLIAGAGDYELQLRAMAAGNPHVRFLGALTQDELGGLYYHAVACIIPSVTYETFGLTGIEAFARKTPVIARNLGGLSELVEDSGGGLLFHTGEEFIDAVIRLAGSSELRTELGQKGYEAFIHLWSREAHLKLYFDFVNRAARKKFGHLPWSDAGITSPEES